MTIRTRAILAFVALTAACAGASPSRAAPAAELAIRAEQEAFAAIDDKQWCLALERFIEANTLAPTADLIFNAARAAELAGDRRLAVLLYTEALGAGVPDARRVDVKRKLAELASLVEKDGAGTPCTPHSPPHAAAGPIASDLAMSPSPPSSSQSLATYTATKPLALASEGPRSDEIAAIMAQRAERPFPWALTSLGTGIATVVGGAVVAAYGASPWLDYGAAQSELQELARTESNDLDRIDDAYARQVDAERRWNDFGRYGVVGGAVLVGAGALLVATGGTLLALDEDGAVDTAGAQ